MCGYATDVAAGSHKEIGKTVQIFLPGPWMGLKTGVANGTR